LAPKGCEHPLTALFSSILNSAQNAVNVADAINDVCQILWHAYDKDYSVYSILNSTTVDLFSVGAA